MATKHIYYLDGWRGLAILAVFLGHFGKIQAINFGPFGVELFFALSGRLMADLLVVRGTPLKTFFFRRFSRIYPALAVFCTAMLAVSGAGLLLGFHIPKGVGLPEYFSAMFFVMNYTTSLFGMHTVIEHTWSLSVEEHSYALLALMVLMIARKRVPAAYIALFFAGLMMSSGIAQAVLTTQSEHELYWRTDVRGASVFLSFGVYLLINPLGDRSVAQFLPKFLPIFAFFIAVFLNFGFFPFWLKYSLGTILIALSVNTIDFSYEWIKDFLGRKWIVFLGTLSYSLYLWHPPFSLLSDRVGVVVGLAGSLIAAAASYYIVERPSRRKLNAWFDSRRLRHVSAPNPI